MEQGRDERWGAELGKRIALAVREHRQRRKMTVEALSRRCEELGWAISRSKLTNLEIGKRTNVTLPETFILAAALGVPLDALLYPGGMHDRVEVIPGVEMSTLDAVSWSAAAEPTLPSEMPQGPGDRDYYTEVAGRFLVARIVAEHLAEVEATRDQPEAHRQALDDLAGRLADLPGLHLGWPEPVLPEHIAAELAAYRKPPGSRLIPPEHRRRRSTAPTGRTS